LLGLKRFALATLVALFGTSSAQLAASQLNLNVLLAGPAVSGDQAVMTLLVEDGPGPQGNGSGNEFDHYRALTLGGGSNRFNLYDTFQYLVTAPDLDAVDFIVANGDGHDGYAHFQGIDGGSADDIATAPDDGPAIPEPTSLLLLGTGLIAGGYWLRKRSKASLLSSDRSSLAMPT
jgi:hypothetical protein